MDDTDNGKQWYECGGFGERKHDLTDIVNRLRGASSDWTDEEIIAVLSPLGVDSDFIRRAEEYEHRRFLRWRKAAAPRFIRALAKRR